jgi:hypothetical protein
LRRSNFALRLQPSLMEGARKAAESEGVALNQLTNVALAEKLSALPTEEYFPERMRRSDRTETLRILSRLGKGNPPIEGDEIPMDLSSGGNRTRETNQAGDRPADQISRPKRRLRKARSC